MLKLRQKCVCVCEKSKYLRARVTDLIEHLEQLGAGLVDGADNGPSPLGQRLHQGDHLETGGTVETTVTNRSNNLTSIQKCISALSTQEAH